jgi:hypothetical protein
LLGEGRASRNRTIAPARRHPYVVRARRKITMAKKKISFANRQLHLPESKPIRLGIGILLVAGGLVGFLPVVGFWMIPLGLLVLSVDIPIVRRWRRKLALWWHRDRKIVNGTKTPVEGAGGDKMD